MSKLCDECGLPIPVCNMNAMIDEAVRKCGLDVTVFTLRERFIDADTHQPKCVTHEAVSLADYAALLAEIAAKDAEIAELRKNTANEVECGHPWCGDKCGTPSAALKGDAHE